MQCTSRSLQTCTSLARRESSGEPQMLLPLLGLPCRDELCRPVLLAAAWVTGATSDSHQYVFMSCCIACKMLPRQCWTC